MLDRYYQDMHGCGWTDIPEGNRPLIPIDDFTRLVPGDDLAKDAIWLHLYNKLSMQSIPEYLLEMDWRDVVPQVHG